MTKKEKDVVIENMVKQFVELDAVHKAKIIGYMEGVKDEREKWLKKEKDAAAVTA